MPDTDETAILEQLATLTARHGPWAAAIRMFTRQPPARLRCMPPPLSLLCALDDHHHNQHGPTPGLTCTLHDKTAAAWAALRWTLGDRRR